MVDRLTKDQRSRNMARVRGRDTKPEVKLRQALWSRGLRYRKNSKLPGHPDIIFSGASVVIFVDGCFWHGCPEHGSIPASNTQFWQDKIGRNIERDREIDQRLKGDGWQVIRVWEHEIRADLGEVVRRIEAEVCP